jgi:basic amino acid/polyamine antiporter, APA family
VNDATIDTATQAGLRTPSSSLGLFDAVALVAGSMIGSGIFLVSAQIARLTGSPGWLLAVWTLAGLMTIAAALSYGELAAMFPHAGGQYVYLREAFGRMPAFLFGWTQFTVIQTGTIAAVAVAFARFAGVFVPALDDHPLLGASRFAPTPQRLLAIGLLVLLTYANTRGLQTGRVLQNLFTSAKTLVLVALVLVGLVFAASVVPAAGESLTTRLFALGPFPGGLIGPAMVGALFASDAWNNVTFTAGEVRNPARTLPLALLFGTLLTTLLYLAVNLSYLVVLPLGEIAHAPSDRVASAMIHAAFPTSAWPAYAVAFGILISTFGCVNGMVLAGARVSYAMARDGLFFRQAGELNAARVPAAALWMQGLWASLLCLSGTYSQLLDYVIFAVLLFYMATIAGLFRLRQKRPDAPRPYRAVGYPLLPAAYFLAAGAVATSLVIAPVTRQQSLAGLLCVVVGVPVYLVLLSAKSAQSSKSGKEVAP